MKSRVGAIERARGVRVYTGRQLDMIAMPIGGIGAGCVSLGGWGQLRDWEIFGRPGKGIANDMAFFTLHAHRSDRPSDRFTKVLQGPAGGPRMGPATQGEFAGGGSGTWGRGHAAGLPHFDSCSFAAHYPFAELSLQDSTASLAAALTAWNPFIPLNDHDSSIPCAIFQWTIRNPTRRRWSCTLLANLTNMVGYPDVGGGINAFRESGRARGISFTTGRHEAASPRFGSMALATSHRPVTWLAHWLRGGWFDALTDFWRQAETGDLDVSVPAEQSPARSGDTASLGLRFALGPGESRTLPIVIAWHNPTQERYWGGADGEGPRPVWKSWMASQWKDAWEVAEYVLTDLPRLERETRLYDETLRASTLPEFVLESVSATSSTLKSPTCLRLSDGKLWAWEGCNDTAGCCEGSCTHVWNYQQMVPYLFPSLERTLRETDYRYSLHPDGHMAFRLPLPLGTPGNPGMHAAADGQLGGILKLYRDWKISGDDDWLGRLWPAARRSLEFAWLHWDRDRDGVLEGVQHNTYDIELWGPNTLGSSFYLGALRAAEGICLRLGDMASAESYRGLFQKGREWIEAHLWNGEYYEQHVDPGAGRDDPYARPAAGAGPPTDSGGSPKYQYGSGCLSDQLLGQLFAEMLELGDLLDGTHVSKAAESIFRHNFRQGFFDHANPQRVYTQDEESGLLLCTWPHGGKPEFPFPYSDEVWTGIEYTTAALLVYRGHVRQALRIVRALRDRHDGTRRNPFDEFECGHHYARAMASYALLLALSGFAADLPHRRLAFRPRISQEDFACFYSVETGWGLYRQRLLPSGSARFELEVRYGSLELRVLSLPALGRRRFGRGARGGRSPGEAKVRLGRTAIKAALARTPRGRHRGPHGGVDVVLGEPVTVRPGVGLRIEISRLTAR